MTSLPTTGSFKVLVKPNSQQNSVAGYDTEKKAFVIHIKAPADKDKANKELIKFLSKHYKKKVCIKSGLCSREKVLQIL